MRTLRVVTLEEQTRSNQELEVTLYDTIEVS